MWTIDATMPPIRYDARNPSRPNWSSTLFPKIHKNNMFPSTCRIEAWRNIEKSTASQTFLCGNAVCGVAIPVAEIAHEVGATSPSGTTTTGLPVRISQGTPAHRYSNRASAFPPCLGNWIPK